MEGPKDPCLGLAWPSRPECPSGEFPSLVPGTQSPPSPTGAGRAYRSLAETPDPASAGASLLKGGPGSPRERGGDPGGLPGMASSELSTLPWAHVPRAWGMSRHGEMPPRRGGGPWDPVSLHHQCLPPRASVPRWCAPPQAGTAPGMTGAAGSCSQLKRGLGTASWQTPGTDFLMRAKRNRLVAERPEGRVCQACPLSGPRPAFVLFEPRVPPTVTRPVSRQRPPGSHSCPATSLASCPSLHTPPSLPAPQSYPGL